MRRIWIAIIAIIVAVSVAAGALWYYARSESFAALVSSQAADMAAESLGVPVDVGSIEVLSLHELKIDNAAIYDKQAECIARVDEARVHFSLLSAFSQPSARMVDQVQLRGVTANLKQRDDGSWNFNDIQTDASSQNEFRGRVDIEDATVTGEMRGKQLTLDDVSGQLDFADYPVLKVKAQAHHGEAEADVEGTLRSDRQIVEVKLQNAELADYLYLVPEGLIPDSVELKQGHIEQAQASVLRRGDNLSFSGTADFSEGAVGVQGIDVADIAGYASFNEKSVLLDIKAAANDQPASVTGSLSWADGTPYMDLRVRTDGFDPSQVLPQVSDYFTGTLSGTAEVRGTFTNPSLTGEVNIPQGTVRAGGHEVALADAHARLRLVDGYAYATELRAGVLGGSVQGELSADLRPLGLGGGEPTGVDDVSYSGHVRFHDLAAGNIAGLAGYDGLVSGSISGDVGLQGQGLSAAGLEAFGSANLVNGSYLGLAVESLSTSFYLADDDLTIDYLSARLPNHTNLGLEGSIEAMRGGRRLDLAFYGGHVDLSLLSQLYPQLDMSGLADFQGEVHGDAANPHVDLKFSGLHGQVFKQPFDTLAFTADGSLDGIGIQSFLMEKDGREVWRVEGYAGFTGEKKVNLEINTMGARMEDIAALIAPDQPLTGNVDNIIKITGTLDDPSMVGYIHFYRGSYMGVLLSGMDGDYFLDNGILRLQDFHVYSPMVDMVLNGTIDRQRNLKMVVEANDIDMERIKHKLPYEVSGHGTFHGDIGGNITAPTFDGTLDAPELIFNDQKLTNIHGRVKYAGGMVSCEDFGCQQGEGSLDMAVTVNAGTHAIEGNVVLQKADINVLTALLNAKNDVVKGQLSAGVELSGSLDNPTAALQGEIPQGTVAGYDVHGVAIDMQLLNKILYVNKLAGQQGDKGVFQASGTMDLHRTAPLDDQGIGSTFTGPLDMKLQASDIAVGMFTKAAGLDAEVIGTADVEAVAGGTISNPTVDMTINGHNGGVQGSTFDTAIGVLHLQNGSISVDQLEVAKAVSGKTYKASASGIVPLRALVEQHDTRLDDYDQIHLTVDLSQADLSLLPQLSSHFDWAVGATTGQLLISGTLAHPMLNGSISIPEGALKIKELKQPLTDMAVKINFNGNHINIEKCCGRMGGGDITASGDITLDGITPQQYDLKLTSNKLGIESDFFNGPLNADFELKNAEIFGHSIPKLSGTLDFHDCLVSIPSIPDSDGELPDILLDVNLNVGRKVHFYNSMLYDLYLAGQAHFGGTTRHPQTYGSIAVQRGGTVNYLKTVFKIREGVATFNQVDSFLPSLNFVADTRLTQARVRLELRGPLDNIEFHLTSEPKMSQTQIIQLLTLRNAYKNGQTNLDAGDLLAVGLQMSLLSEVEDVVRNLFFLDSFTIARGSGSISTKELSEEHDRDEYNVEMGKFVSDKVMLKYTRGIGASSVNRYGVQYDANDRYSLTLENESGNVRFGVEARISF